MIFSKEVIFNLLLKQRNDAASNLELECKNMKFNSNWQNVEIDITSKIIDKIEEKIENLVQAQNRLQEFNKIDAEIFEFKVSEQDAVYKIYDGCRQWDRDVLQEVLDGKLNEKN